jgi:hypothetical protein
VVTLHIPAAGAPVLSAAELAAMKESVVHAGHFFYVP